MSIDLYVYINIYKYVYLIKLKNIFLLIGAKLASLTNAYDFTL